MNKKDKRNVTIYVNGGLGNQLFGLAAGYALSRRIKCGLKLNLSLLDSRKLDIPKSIIESFEVEQKACTYYSIQSILFKKIYRIVSSKTNYFERHFDFNKEFNQLSAPIRLHGYFQSWLYFSDCFQDIYKLLTASFSPSDEYQRQLSRLPKQFIAVHIRRGDYLQNLEFHGIAERKYYMEALRLIDIPATSNKLVIFTDTPKAAKEIFPNHIIVSPSELVDPFENLMLMSQAQFIIGANSTFSLWAAFLASANGAGCIFPSQWFGDKGIKTETLMPSHFKRI